MLYAIEAIDAAGKATQAQRLAERLGCHVLSFPDYSSPTGRAISGHLRAAWWAAPPCPVSAMRDVPKAWWDGVSHSGLDMLVRQSLMLTNRMEHFDALSLASGSKTHHLVLDRYWASGLVYGRVEGLDQNWLELIHRPLPKADRWILLDIPVGESYARRPVRRDTNETDRGKLEAVAAEYRRVWAERGWQAVDGVGSIEEVATRVWKAIGL